MTKRTTLIFAAALAIGVVFVVHALDFPGSVPRFEKLSGGGVLLDAVPSFNVDDVYRRLSDYGQQGRDSYRFRNVTVDVLLPLSVLPLLFLITRQAVERSQRKRLFRGFLFALPFAYVVLDFAENAQVLFLLNNYPRRIDAVAGILPYVTSLKRAASLLAIFVPLAMLAFQFFRSRQLAHAAAR